jgi:hypothetical protein
MKTRGAAPSSRNRDKAAASAKAKGEKSPMARFSSLTRSVLGVSNKAVLEAEAREKVENARRRKQTKRKPAST